MKKRRNKFAKPTAAMLSINNTQNDADAAKAIVTVLAVTGHELATYQEAMRTLAVIAKSPEHVAVQNCQFTSRK